MASLRPQRAKDETRRANVAHACRKFARSSQRTLARERASVLLESKSRAQIKQVGPSNARERTFGPCARARPLARSLVRPGRAKRAASASPEELSLATDGC